MAKTYFATFGSGNPSSNAGLSPTFIQFWKFDGTTLAPPAISEIAGTSSGLYKFSYTPSFTVGFVIDGATSGLATNVRYLTGVLDPLDNFNQSNIETGMGTTLLNFNTIVGTTLSGLGATVIAIGNTLAAIGISTSALEALIGTVGSTFGGTGTDPLDLFGYLKRAQEFWEGNDSFSKATGVWSIYSRGASYQLQSKTLSNDVTGVTKI